MSGASASVPMPADGQTLSIPSAPGSIFALSFDPAQALFSREGDSAVFEINGGRVILNDFFAVGENTLPFFKLPDGSIVASADIFTDMDLTTAAGPAASSATGSGLSSYADDPGSLIGGIDRLGSLGTFYWDRSTEVPEDYIGATELPGGTFLFDITSDVGGAFFAGLYEDGQPDKHLGINTVVYGQLSFTPQLSGSTVIDAIRLSGFDKGTVIYFGDPSQDGQVRGITITDSSQVIDFTMADFSKGVYLMPPPHSDHDMPIAVVINMHAASSGARGSVAGGFVIIVDAVADKPALGIAGFDGDNLDGCIFVGGHENLGFNKGWHTVEDKYTGDESVTLSIPFSVTIRFEDYELGHERHYALIEIPTSDAAVLYGTWTCEYNGVTYGYTAGPDGSISGDVVVHDGHLYFKIPVDNADIAAAGGTIAIDAVLSVSGTAGSIGVDGRDAVIGLNVGAMAQEHPTDKELRLDNNVAFDISDNAVPLSLDVVNSGLTVKGGWASEGNRPDKHLDGGVYDQSGLPEFGATSGAGAPIQIALDNPGGSNGTGNSEYITQITLSHGGGQGHFVYTFRGADYVLDPANPDGLPANVGYNAATGEFTIRFTAADNITGLTTASSDYAVHYRPDSSSYSDTDVAVHYRVTVENGKGTSAVYEGQVMAVVDPVADLPVDVGARTDLYDNDPSYGAADWESSVEITIKGRFFDLEDGSEKHYFLLEARQGWGNPEGYPTVVHNGTAYFYVDITDPGVTDMGNGNFEFTFVLETPKNLPENDPARCPDADRIAQDQPVTLRAGALAVEGSISENANKDGHHEVEARNARPEYAPDGSYRDGGYDVGNNVAFAPSDISVAFNVIDAGTGGATRGAYEDHMNDKHLYGADAVALAGDGKICLLLADSNGHAVNEHITGGVFSYTFAHYMEGMDLGSFTINGIEYAVNDYAAVTVKDDGSALVEFDFSRLPADPADPGGPNVIDSLTSALPAGRTLTGIDLYYNPPFNDDTSLDNFVFGLDVRADNSKAESTVHGVVRMLDEDGNLRTDVAPGTVIVDAVADKPAVSPGEAYYADGSRAGDAEAAQSAAKAAESVKITLDSVQFHDYIDGSESHFILMYARASIDYGTGRPASLTMDVTRTQTIAIGGGGFTQEIKAVPSYKDCSITLKGPDGEVIVVINGNGVITYLGGDTHGMFDGLAAGDALPGLSFAWANQMLASQNVGNGVNGYRIPVLNELLQQCGGNVSAEFEANAHDPGAIRGDGQITVEVGALAREKATDLTHDELTLDNNVATDTGKITFAVAVVTSDPVITIEHNQIYENLTPNAHLNADHSNGKAVVDPATLADGTHSEGALIIISNIHGGETAKITFTFSAFNPNPDGSGRNLPVDFNSAPGHKDDFMRLELVDGEGAVLDTYPVTLVDGVWTAGPMVIEGGHGDAVLVFKPGYNYNSSDISIQYTVTVTDGASHDSTTWNAGDSDKTPVLDVLVDAVAQAPVIESVGADVPAIRGNGGINTFVPGSQISLQARILYQDYTDGSERHYVLVQARPGWNPPSGTLVAIDGHGNAHDIPVTWGVQKIDGVLYYKAEVPNSAIKAHGNNGLMDMRISMESPADTGGSVKFRVGGGAWEDKAIVDGEITWDNNFSFVTASAEVLFSGPGRVSLVPSHGVYENDKPNAHDPDNRHNSRLDVDTDEDGKAGGTTLTLSCNDNDVITNLTISYNESQGTMYYKDAEGTWQKISSGQAIPGEFHNKDTLAFIPGHNYNDADLNFSYTATVTDPRSGGAYIPDKPLTGTIIVDAVAQQPTDLSPENRTDAVYGSEGPATVVFPLSVVFNDDWASDTTTHYVLVEAKANMTVAGSVGTFSVRNPQTGAYTTYHKVPVNENDLTPVKDGEGNITGYKADVEVSLTISRMGSDNPDNIIKVGALVEKYPEDGNLELTYHNNVSYADGGFVNVNYGSWGKGHHLVAWEDAFENDTPNAHLGDYTAAGGAQVSFGSIDQDEQQPITRVELTWDTDLGYFCVKDDNGGIVKTYEWDSENNCFRIRDASGEIIGSVHSGSITIDAPDLKHLYFVPNNNNRDDDAAVRYSAYDKDGNTASGEFTIIIDAVAQKPTNLDSGTVRYPDADDPDTFWRAMGDKGNGGNDGTAVIRVSGSFVDNDGSERHYALVEQQPGFKALYQDADGNWHEAEVVYLEGRSYFMVEMAHTANQDGNHIYTLDGKGKEYADVKLVVDDYSKVSPGGYALQTGLLAEEQSDGTQGKLESTLKNNISWTLGEEGQEAFIEVSFVKSSVSVTVADTYENQPTAVVIEGVLGADDSFTGMTIGHSGKGTLSVEDPHNAGGWHIDDGGNLVITDFNAIGKIVVTFIPADHDDEDVIWTWTAGFANGKSGDAAHSSGSGYTIVDAVADKPDLVDMRFASDNGTDAVVAGGGAAVTVTLNFDDMSGREEHYAILQQGSSTQGDEWLCDGARIYDPASGGWAKAEIITLYSEENGTPYYAVKIPHALHTSGGEAIVEFHVVAPGYVDERYGIPLSAGGIAVEPGTGVEDLHKELTLDNNWGESIGTVEANVGKFVTEGVELGVSGDLVENDADGIALSFTGVAADKHEALMEMTFTVSQNLPDGTPPPEGTVIGTIWYNGSSFELVVGGDGTASAIVDFGPDGYDPLAKCRLVLADENGNPNHNSEPVTIATKGTVWDSGLDETRTFTDSCSLNVRAVADAPTDITGTTPVWDAGESTLSFSVSASFADVDGSERHYLLVEARDGWELDPAALQASGGVYAGIKEAGGVRYFQIEVDGRLAAPSIDVVLKAPVGGHTEALKLGGFSEEVKNGVVTDSSVVHEGRDVPIDFVSEAGFRFATASGMVITEGIDADFTLHLCNGSGVAMTAAEDITLVLSLTGAPHDFFQTGAFSDADGNAVAWGYDGETGTYTVTATLTAGHSELTISPHWTDNMGLDGIIGNHGTSIGITLESLQGDTHGALPGLSGALADNSGAPLDGFTCHVADADSALAGLYGIGSEADGMALVLLDDSRHYDGSSSMGDHVIIGTDGNDTFIVGPGNAILVGGEGADTFAFGLGGFSADNGFYSSRIADFNLDSGDRLDFTDIFGSGLDFETFSGTGNAFSLSGESGNILEALFGETGIDLAIKDPAGNTLQHIELNMAGGYVEPIQDAAAMALLEQMIKSVSGA